MVSQFPYFSQLVDAAFLVFDSSTKAFIGLAPLVLLVRIFIIKSMFRSSLHYGQLLRDLMLMYIGFFFFEEVVRFVLKVPQYAENLIGTSDNLEISKFKSSGSMLGLLGYTLDEILKYISIISYWIMAFVYFIFLSLMICLGGFVVFFSTMFQMRWMSSAFFVLLAMLSMWPFLWYIVDHSVSEILKHMVRSQSEMAIFATNLGGNTVKIGVPFLSLIYALKDPVNVTGSLKESFSRGYKPIGGVKSIAQNKARGLANIVGADKVYKGHITPRVEKIRVKIGATKDKSLNRTRQIAPLATYGLSKGLKKINPSNSVKGENLKTFSSYKKNIENRIVAQDIQKFSKYKNFQSKHKHNSFKNRSTKSDVIERRSFEGKNSVHASENNNTRTELVNNVQVNKKSQKSSTVTMKNMTKHTQVSSRIKKENNKHSKNGRYNVDS